MLLQPRLHSARKALASLALLAFVVAPAAGSFTFPEKAVAAGTWNPVVSDSFARANASSIGNGWVDPAGVGSIASNTLVLTAPPVGASTGNIRVLRPTSEASLNQKIDVTSTLADTSGSIGHGVVLRGKSVVIGGIDITPAITVTFRHSGSLSFALAYNGYTDYLGSGVTGTSSFTPTVGHSYTLSVSILNNFPAVVNAIVTDNTTSTQVANASYNISGEYGSQDLSPYWKTAGVAGLTLEASAGQSVSIANVTTYSYSDTGTFTAPGAFLETEHDSKTYLATPLPTGGTAPYTIRWYRGVGNFTPPTAIDGSGSGTGTYTFIGTGQEIVDTTAPTGVSNFSNTYRPVFFDSGANASTGLVAPIQYFNSPTSKSLAVPVWVGDSITYGYQTSNWANSPAKYANAQISADGSVTSAWIFKFIDGSSYQQVAVPGRTSTDASTGTNLSGLVSFMADRRVSVASIMLGTNDAKDSVATSAATYKSNIQTILAAMKAVNPNVRVVLNKPLWFKPDTGYGADFSTASLARVANYSAKLDQLADGTSIVVGSNSAYTEIQTYGWTGTTGVNNAANATTSYPPAPTGGKSYLTDGLHPYDGGAQMVGTTEWGPNVKSALLANYTPAYDVTPPTFAITSANSNNAVPSSAKAGNVVTVVFSASETLSANPTVTLGGQPMTYASKTGLAYTYTRTLTGAETEGSAAIAISGSDVAGNAGTGSGSFTTDFTAPPAPSITTPTSAVATNASTATIAGTAEANALVRLYTDPNHDGNPSDGTLVSSQQLTGGTATFSFVSVPLALGSNYFVVTAADAVGNVSATAAVVPTISRDNVNPVIAILSPATGGSYLTSQSSIVVSGSASDDVGVLSVASSAGGTITGTTTWSQTVSLGEGANPFTFTAHDAAGNTGMATIVVTRDSVSPSMASISVASDNANTSVGRVGNTVTAVFTSSEALAANPVVTLGTKPMTYVSKTGLVYTYTRVLDGSETASNATLSIQSQDMAGNSGVDTSRTFLTDFSVATATPSPSETTSATPTSVPSTLTATLNGASLKNGIVQASSRPTFSGSAPAGAQVTVTVHSDPVQCFATANSSGNWSCTMASDLPEGRHSVDVTATTPNGQSVSLAAFPIDVNSIPSLAKTGNATKSVSLIGLVLLLTAGGALTRRHLAKAHAN